MSDETATLAAFAANLSLDDVPSAIRTSAIELLIDQLGVQLGCSHLPWAQQVRHLYAGPGGAAEATVTRYGERLPVASAAFINSVFGHSFEYDDANPLCHGHLGGELIPALLAVAEREHASGRDFLAALVAGYEVRGRIGWAVSPDLLKYGGPQYSTSCGPFGVAAGLGRLLRAPAQLIDDAMGIAGTFSGGLMQYEEGGGSVKRMFTAVAASSGIQAYFLAQAGITGPERILEGGRGLLRIFPKEFRPERLTTDLGSRWMMEYMLFKPYSCCAVIHPAIDALGGLLEENALAAADIESIGVGYPKVSYHHAAVTEPQDLLGMQFSTTYSLAIAALKGGNTPHHYSEAALADPAIKALAARVHASLDPTLEQLFEDGHMAARVTVRSKDGRRFDRLVEDARGSRAVKFTPADVDAKFSSQAEGVLGAEAAAGLLGMLKGVEDVADMAEVARMLVAADAP